MPRMMESGKQYQIANGPPKLDLMNALFTGNSSSRRLVTFVVEGIGYIEVQIDEVGRESGSGESWMLRGYERLVGNHMRPVKGYFDTQSRQGHITPHPND